MFDINLECKDDLVSKMSLLHVILGQKVASSLAPGVEPLVCVITSVVAFRGKCYVCTWWIWSWRVNNIAIKKHRLKSDR